MTESPPTEEELEKMGAVFNTLSENSDDKRFCLRMGIYDQREECFLNTKVDTVLAIDPDEPLVLS